MTEKRPHCHGHRQRLRQRFARSGFTGFHDYEVVELLLTLAIPRSDVKQSAKALISEFGNLRGIMDASIAQLRGIDGLGSVAPTAIKIIRETATLYLQQTTENRSPVTENDSLVEMWRMRIGALRDEVFEVAYLDSAFCLMPDGIERLEEGTIDRATVYPRRVVEAALQRGAKAIVLAHNHPNGNTKPSEQDKLITRSIVLAAETIRLNVHDHLVITRDAAFSFRNQGLL